MMRFQDKICLVTRATSGIGKVTTAIAFAKEGAKVMVSDINEHINAFVAAIHSQSGTAIGKTCDISDWNSVKSLIHTTVKQFGRLDCAVNSAGIAGK